MKYFPSRVYEEDDFMAKGALWYKQQHVFNNAFYYIDYVLAENFASLLHSRKRELQARLKQQQ
ncbi:MAG: hypothetical protein R3Y32_07685 [Bacillota bacterium]